MIINAVSVFNHRVVIKISQLAWFDSANGQQRVVVGAVQPIIAYFQLGKRDNGVKKGYSPRVSVEIVVVSGHFDVSAVVDYIRQTRVYFLRGCLRR